MARSNETLAAAPEDDQVTLHEFCARLSETDRRVSLIGGFEHDERTNDRIKDTESAFAARYEVFINKPA